jgi:hypothetical protein
MISTDEGITCVAVHYIVQGTNKMSFHKCFHMSHAIFRDRLEKEALQECATAISMDELRTSKLAAQFHVPPSKANTILT